MPKQSGQLSKMLSVAVSALAGFFVSPFTFVPALINRLRGKEID